MMNKRRAKLILLLTVLTTGGLYFCPRMLGPFAYQAIRRSKVSADGLNYQSLISVIEKGEELIHGTGNLFVASSQGSRNLKHLNAIPFHYRGPEALYWLAMDLELAIRKGYIFWEGSFEGFAPQRLNRLSDSFLKTIDADKAALPWRTFFDWKGQLESATERCRGNEGQIRFAFENNVGDLNILYNAFLHRTEQYGWTRLGVNLSSLRKAKELFEAAPSGYTGEDGQRRLARRADIIHPNILYYARGEFRGYSQEKFEWREDLLSDTEFSAVALQLQRAGLPTDHLEPETQRRFCILIRARGLEETISFLEETGIQGFNFISESEENLDLLVKLSAVMDNWRDFFVRYFEIENLIEECCRIYGSQARGLSPRDSLVYRELFADLENNISEILRQVNRFVLITGLEPVTEVKDIILRAQEDLALLFEILLSYKKGELTEITNIGHPSRHRHRFDTAGRDCQEIILDLHEYRTSISQASIRWEIRRLNGERISLRLDLDDKRDTVCMDVVSPALEKIYQILKRQSGHHFYLDIPGLASEAVFKILVRVFY